MRQVDRMKGDQVLSAQGLVTRLSDGQSGQVGQCHPCKYIVLYDERLYARSAAFSDHLLGYAA